MNCLLTAGLLIVVGALLYNYQKVKMFSYNARNPASSYPVYDEKVSYGFLLSVISGVLLSLGAVLEISQLVIADARRSALSQVQPSDESAKEKSDDKCWCCKIIDCAIQFPHRFLHLYSVWYSAIDCLFVLKHSQTKLSDSGFFFILNFRETYEFKFLLNCQVIQALLGP